MRCSLLLLALLPLSCSKPEPLKLEVLGDNYQWYIRYPGPDETLQTSDDIVVRQHMAVPANTDLELMITSTDLLYVFRVPELNQKQMAVPEIIFDLEMNTGKPGSYELAGDQMCGFAHDSLIGSFKVLPAKEFQAWLKNQEKQAHPQEAQH